MIAYLIKSVLCQLVLWGFYKIAFEQQSAHIFKRFYLLVSLIIALALPLITISYTVTAVAQSTDMLTYVIPTITQPSKVVAETTNWPAVALWAIYALGVIVFSFRFLKNIGQIRSKIRQNIHVFAQKAVHILIESNIVPHTFLNYIFLPRAAYETNRIPQEILRHEQAHVTQKHTLDILFIEVLQVVFWFNPLLYFIKRSIALNHEFLADQKAIDRQKNPENYINLLINHAQSPHHAPMTSALNYSLTRPPYRRAKKRILMISQSFSAKKLAARLAFLVPVLALCIYFFNQDIVAKPINDKKQTSTINQQIQEQPTLKVNISGETVTINGKETTAKDFAETIDQITAKWTEKDIMSYSIHLQSDNGVNQFVGKLANAFHNTRLYKTNPSKELIPPPPPPAPEPSKIGAVPKSPPTPPSTLASQKDPDILYLTIIGKQVLLNNKEITVDNFAKTFDNTTNGLTQKELKKARLWLKITNPDKKITKQLEEEYKKTRLYKAQPDHGLIPPPPPAPASPEFSNIAPPMPPTPPAPPTLPSPEKMLEDMTAASADFYYNGDKITSEKAKKLFKSKNNLSFMATEAKKGNKPMVLITDN